MIKKISKMKLADLRKLAKKDGVEDWDTLETRDELIKAISVLGESELKESTPEIELEERPEPETEEDGVEGGRAPVGTKAEIMKASLAKQEKVSIIIPRESNDAEGSTFAVNLNGYRMNIQKGRYVSVPKQIAEMVMKHFDQTASADAFMIRKEDGKSMRIDGSPSPLE